MGKIDALISLLDDNDRDVVKAVTDEFIKQGLEVIPELERIWEQSNNARLQERLEDVIHNIQFNITVENLRNWNDTGAKSLLEGSVFIAQSQFPGVTLENINNFFERMKSEFSSDIKTRTTALEKVKLMNYVIFHIYQFTRNNQNFFSPQNSYLNQVIESRKGTPLSLSLIYLILAEKLSLPIYGVNLPKNFILAYKNEYRHIDSPEESDDILFYVNPYNKGSIISKKEIDYFLARQGLEEESSYYLPCNNRAIITRLITNLIVAYEKLGYNDKIKLLQELARVIKEDYNEF
ncbi:MAG: transglutaminase-like domain-containing protein [Bacteroidales bacterium]|nr:transglutaminase-like domain-containing protein [Bacteroidales bacterium]